MSEKRQGAARYDHPLLHETIWSTVPDSIPIQLQRRYMKREAIRGRALDSQRVVYYLRMPEQSPKAGLIKIGHTEDLTQRLSQLTAKYGGRPEVLATEPGDGPLEEERHSRFGHISVGGFNEYFQADGELMRWIDQVVAIWGPPMITGPLPPGWPWPE
ncbi:MAG: GIY-YIG nuclease family protein [Propionicimonas sp.]|uniref:GIY-YIG nuclease family protein n=1 Tax=Propionicimonas sp. TaxID=1955623 RepID=UPI003D1361F8